MNNIINNTFSGGANSTVNKTLGHIMAVAILTTASFTAFNTHAADALVINLKSSAQARADGVSGGRDALYTGFPISEMFEDEHISLSSEIETDPAYALSTNQLDIHFDSTTGGSIRQLTDQVFEETYDWSSGSLDNPDGMTHYYTDWSYVFKATDDGVFWISMSGEATSDTMQYGTANASVNLGNGELITFRNGVYKNGITSVSVPVEKNKFYVFRFTSNFGPSGAIRSFHNQTNITTDWAIIYNPEPPTILGNEDR